MESIYDRYGGQTFWDGVIGELYEKNLTDEGLRGFFEGKNIERVKAMNRALLAAALRTSEEHFPISIKRVHRNFGIREAEFDTFVKNFEEVLARNGVSKSDLQDIMTVVTSFREDIITA
jgi:hemoglobin